MSEPINAGLWKKTSQKGNTYYGVSKPVKIDGKKYWISVFKNTNENPKSPDLDLFINEAEEREQRPAQDDNDDIPF